MLDSLTSMLLNLVIIMIQANYTFYTNYDIKY
jgi:hypothetical protein